MPTLPEVVFLLMSELSKNVKLTPEAHSALVEASESRYGTRRIRFSNVIKTLCQEETARQEADE